MGRGKSSAKKREGDYKTANERRRDDQSEKLKTLKKGLQGVAPRALLITDTL